MPRESNSDPAEGTTARFGSRDDPEYPRQVRSFVRREGRITRAQMRALAELWPRYGLDVEKQPPRYSAVFGREAPLCMEIGFGNGEALVWMAKEHPDHDFIGIEVYRPGVGALLLKLEESGLANVRIFQDDAVAVLRHSVPNGALAAVFLFFPDPWPKKRHHKRRLLQQPFAELVRQKLEPDGIFHMATDWHNYAEHMRELMDAQPGFENVAGPGMFSPDPRWRPPTRFERRGRALGHGVWDLIYRRVT